MESVAAISKRTELAEQSSDSLSLTTASGISPSDGMACLLLMKQTRDRYTNQTITEGTAEMYLVQWEEMAMAFGMLAFTAALSKVIRASKFFPDPLDIRAVLESGREEAFALAEGLRVIRELDEAKAIWERERAEEQAAGGRVKTEAELRLEALLKKANEPRKPSVGAYVAPVQMTAAEIMERVSRERGEREAGAR